MESTTECICCWTEIEGRSSGIKCPKYHRLCLECSKDFIKHILQAPQERIPAKCSICSSKIESRYLRRLMTEDEKKCWRKYRKINAISEDQKLANCPFCDYIEIWPKEKIQNYFECKGKCQKKSCFICSDEIKPSNDHSGCYEFECMKKEWEEMMIDGNQRLCPDCKIGGMKDENCTHITCSKCNNKYCYFCESSLTNISDHNSEWKYDSSKCPMRLSEISEIDNRWNLADEEQRLKFFHKLILYSKVRTFVNKYGKEKCKALFKKFKSVREEGIDIEEVMSMNLTMIHRIAKPKPRPRPKQIPQSSNSGCTIF